MATVPASDPTTPPDYPAAKPAFLRRVQIRGYKSIAFCDVTLEPLTILVGRNASGKSNFLDALAFLADAMTSGVAEAVKRRGGWPTVYCKTALAKGVRFDLEIHLSGEELADIAGWDLTEWPDYMRQFVLPVRFNPDNSYLVIYSLTVNAREQEPAYVEREAFTLFQGDLNLSRGFTYEDGVVYANERIGTDLSPTGRMIPVMRKIRNILLPLVSSDATNPLYLHVSDMLGGLRSYNFHPHRIRQLQKPNRGWLLDSDGSNLPSVIESTRENDPGTVERIGQYLSAITETVELQGVAKYGEFETVRFKIPQSGRDQPLEFDAAAMSDGTLRVLAVLVAAFQTVSPQGSPSLVAMEEPETALHPAAMRALVSALDEATLRTQILLTTHSPDLLDATEIKPENIRVVEMIDGSTAITRLDEVSSDIVRLKRDTLGGLERQNQLQLDLDDLDRQRALAANGREAKV